MGCWQQPMTTAWFRNGIAIICQQTINNPSRCVRIIRSSSLPPSP